MARSESILKRKYLLGKGQGRGYEKIICKAEKNTKFPMNMVKIFVKIYYFFYKFSDTFVRKKAEFSI